jgi:hypothetical protein
MLNCESSRLDANQPDPFVIQRSTFSKVGGTGSQQGICAASIPIMTAFGDDGDIPALL